MRLEGVYYRALAPCLGAICLAWAAAALVMSLAGLSLGTVVQEYLGAAVWVTLSTALIAVLLKFIHCDRRKLQRPVPHTMKWLRARWPLLLLPSLLSPLFLAAYTTAKTGIPFLVGFHWDAAFMALDHAIFRADPWRFTHSVLGAQATQVLVIGYLFVWASALLFVQAFVALYGRARLVAVFFSTMMATWLVGGVILAYVFSSAGPALVHAVDPAVGAYFSELTRAISQSPLTAGIATVQGYLVDTMHYTVVTKGGGVSAMPSMHIATATIYILAARGTRWFWPAVAFALFIWVGSVHFGYHYAVDGPVAAAVAWACWHAMSLLQKVLQGSRMPELGRTAEPAVGALGLDLCGRCEDGEAEEMIHNIVGAAQGQKSRLAADR